MRAIITVGLGFGDEGKGSAVDFLVREYRADLVVRYNGGHQAAHNVVLPDGTHHTFSQFGSGTLAGVKTYLGKHTIVEPTSLFNEAKVLLNKTKGGCISAFDLIKQYISVNDKALVTTPWHTLLNQIKETRYRHGSCGKGIGETRKYWLDYGNDSIYAVDFLYSVKQYDTIDKLELCKQRLLAEAQKYITTSNANLILEMSAISAKNWYTNAKNVFDSLNICGEMPLCKTAVFEGAQGILLDEYFGFHPHTTWSTTTSRHAFDELEGQNCSGGILTLGITRTYHTRHGNGPFPSEDKGMIIPHTEHNKNNEWQDSFRIGAFDIPMMHYALSCDDAIDGLFVTCIDHCIGKKIPMMDVCTGYVNEGGTKYGDIPIYPQYSLKNQETVGNHLQNVIPIKTYRSIKDTFSEFTKSVLYTSYGPTHKDKKYGFK